MSNTKSIRERFNTIFNKGPERWLSRSLFEEDDHLSRGRADVEAHRAQGFGREGKPLPAPAIQQRMGSNVEPQEPNDKLNLSRGAQPRGAFQKPEDRSYQPGEPQQKLNKFISSWPKALSKDNFLKAAEEKCILHFRGLCEIYTTSYYRDANNDEYDQIISSFQKYYPNLR